MTDFADRSESTSPGEATPSSTGPSIKKYVEGSLIAERFQIIEKVGGGGMGVVFKATDQVLKRVVAVKVLDSSYKDQDILRFQQEAKACSAFNHPNLLTVLDFGLTGGSQPYLAMEYVSGNTLTNAIKNGNLDLHKSLNILKQICDGMSKAHELNIVHRDLKPSNILLTSTADGAMLVKIIDFGIAKRIDEEQRLTTVGVGIGSPLYMSPEQARGEEVDRRSDIYSFGCIAFEMLTGKVPFKGKDALATLTMHMTHELPALSSFYDTAVLRSITASDNQEMLAGLYEIISRCLSKKAKRRFQDFADVKNALLEFEESIAEKPADEIIEPVKPRITQRSLAWVGGAAFLLFATLVTFELVKIDTNKRSQQRDQEAAIQRKAHKAALDAQNWDSVLDDMNNKPTIGYHSYFGKEITPSEDFVPEDMPKLREVIDRNDVKSLELSHCSIKGPELKALAGSRLRAIRLSADPLTADAFVELSKIPTLESLDIAQNKLSNARDLLPLTRLARLDMLSIMHNNYDGTVFEPIIGIKNLRSLTAGNNPIKGNVPETLGDLKYLHSLFLNDTGCDDRIARVLPRLHSLRKLDLSNNPISSGTVRSMKNLKLELLSVANTKVKGSDLQSIASLPLKSLDLANLGLEDKDCSTLVKFDNLSRLDISSNKITDTGLMRLASLANIAEVKCGGNSAITDRGIAGLQTIKKNIVLYTEIQDPFPMY